MKFCECGCGGIVKNNNRYINGHSFKNKTLSDVHKKNIGKSVKGKKVSKETRKKLSEKATGRILSDETKKKLSEKKKGHIPWNKGKKLGKKWSERVSKNFLGRKHTDDTRMKIRLSTIKQIEEQKLNGEPLTPCIGKIERKFLNEIEDVLKIKILRQYPIRGYFIDGYIPELNLAFEFDEVANHKNINKDLKRQNEIEKFLGCSFFRVSDKEWKTNKKEIINQINRLN